MNISLYAVNALEQLNEIIFQCFFLKKWINFPFNKRKYWLPFDIPSDSADSACSSINLYENLFSFFFPIGLNFAS